MVKGFLCRRLYSFVFSKVTYMKFFPTLFCLIDSRRLSQIESNECSIKMSTLHWFTGFQEPDAHEVCLLLIFYTVCQTQTILCTTTITQLRVRKLSLCIKDKIGCAHYVASFFTTNFCYDTILNLYHIKREIFDCTMWTVSCSNWLLKH